MSTDAIQHEEDEAERDVVRRLKSQDLNQRGVSERFKVVKDRRSIGMLTLVSSMGCSMDGLMSAC